VIRSRRTCLARRSDTPKRDLHALACIRDIVKRFDVVAIQEAQKWLAALRELLVGLGRDWSVILTDPVEDDKGDDERLAFLFDRSRVEVDGLACELVVPYSWSRSKRPKTGIAAIALDRQFARTPYAVSFKRRSAISPWSRSTSTGPVSPARMWRSAQRS
jgi:hypothetical protein